MSPHINPFRPGSPVSPGMFIGRVPELESLESALLQTMADQQTHFMITGERGIGKTSLLLYLYAAASGHISLNNKKHNFLVIDSDINQSTTQLGLIKRIEITLKRELGKSQKARKYLNDVWAFIKRIEIADSRLREKESDFNDEVLLDEFAHSLADVTKRICFIETESQIFSAKYDGILILIDEADNSSPNLNLGSFFKLLTEKLQRLNCNKIMIGLAGLSELREVLRESHPSSLRIFNEVQLNRLTRNEVSSIIDICLEKANEQNPQETTIDKKARELLISLSEGYPHFIQQFGYCAFAADKDGVIDESDVFEGAFGKRGALERIGDGYYRDNFYNKIQKDNYRQVLRIMAKNLDAWTSRSAIIKEFKGKETTLNNALKALKDRHIILLKEGVRGVYRLQHKGFALWIRLYTSDTDIQLQNGKKI